MSDELKDVLARYASGVAILTTRDETGQPHGMTVSSFCPVSLEPPLVLVCVAKSAKSFPVFSRTRDFAVSVLRDQHVEVARRFATSGARKFAAGGFVRSEHGGVVLDGALAAVECRLERSHDAGDHLILVGAVVGHELLHDGVPVVYYDRGFSALRTI
ncbi:flavin reductase family protein [Saccharopolyspora sp. NPDC047091]|uniref:flavin reductase family protein n=1 Tax=Saccharopolyspora sp. NPDC047091 TaxID=3155924 RepID=UPI0033CB5455